MPAACPTNRDPVSRPGAANHERRRADRVASLRVGTDVQAIDEVRASIARFGARYAERIYTRQEIDSVGGLDAIDAASGLAARFAAKEATLKVLRPTTSVPGWRAIEVVRHEGGWCELVLADAALELATEQGIVELALSISHGAGVGMASVVARLTSDLDGRHGHR
jgi:holo-[acyl-carrier protein] synthase